MSGTGGKRPFPGEQPSSPSSAGSTKRLRPTPSPSSSAADMGGVKRPFTGEASSSGSSAKRIRPTPSPSSSSAVSAASSAPDVLELLESLFPHLPLQILEKYWEDCGRDLYLVIRYLKSLASADECGAPLSQGKNEIDSAIRNFDGLRLEQADSEEGPEVPAAVEGYHLPLGVAYWVDVIAGESNIGSDGRARLARFLEKFEKLIRGGPDATELYENEIQRLTREKETLVGQNNILKKGVVSLAKYKKDSNEQSQEVERLRALVSKYEEEKEIGHLKMKIYELEIRLQKELQRSPIPDRFHPDVF